MSLNSTAGNTVMEKWCTKLLSMRVMVYDSISNLPDNISNMKNLRYLKIFGFCTFDCLPTAFYHLYNLQVFCARRSSFGEVILRGFSNMINLQKLESQFLKIDATMENGEEIRLLKNPILITRGLVISNLCEISKDQVEEIIELTKKEYISSRTLKWSEGTSHLPGSPEHNEREVFTLHPPTNTKSVRLECYPGDPPSWFHGSDDPRILSSLTNLTVINCRGYQALNSFYNQFICLLPSRKW
jgi:hypothetical protein